MSNPNFSQSEGLRTLENAQRYILYSGKEVDYSALSLLEAVEDLVSAEEHIQAVLRRFSA